MKAYEITYSVSTTLSWTEAHTESIPGKESLQKRTAEVLRLIEFAQDLLWNTHSLTKTKQKQAQQGREIWFMVLGPDLNKFVLTLLAGCYSV